jgi:hypothetical protein
MTAKGVLCDKTAKDRTSYEFWKDGSVYFRNDHTGHVVVLYPSEVADFVSRYIKYHNEK